MSDTYSTLPDGARAIPGFPDYAITVEGAIFSRRGGVRDHPDRKRRFWIELHQHKMDSGYLVVGLRTPDGKPKQVSVHKLVLTTFVGPCPAGMQCRHLNGNRSDPRLENLAWGTPQENANDRIRHGTTLRGEANPAAVLTTIQVEAVVVLHKAGWGARRIAKVFSVDRGTITQILSGKKWKHVTDKDLHLDDLCRGRKGSKFLSRDDIASLEAQYNAGTRLVELAKDFGITPQGVLWHVRYKNKRRSRNGPNPSRVQPDTQLFLEMSRL